MMTQTLPSRRTRMSSRATSLVVAALLDGGFREPPLAVHPVVAMGRMLDQLARRVPAQPVTVAQVRGGLAWFAGLAGTVAAAVVAERAVSRLPPPIDEAFRGVLLWPLVSLRMLTDEVARVEEGLSTDIETGRRAVSTLVSRPVGDLDEGDIREAAISSLAENMVDGWVAPLLWYSIAGLPAAAAYRYINTADAMWGHRDARWKHAGTVAAYADDLANLVPARLAGVVIAGRQVALPTVRDEARRTPSPNGGWPMAATALRLGIRLSKPGTYELNSHGRPATSDDTYAAIGVIRRHAVILAGAIVTIMALAGRLGRCTCRH